MLFQLDSEVQLFFLQLLIIQLDQLLFHQLLLTLFLMLYNLLLEIQYKKYIGIHIHKLDFNNLMLFNLNLNILI